MKNLPVYLFLLLILTSGFLACSRTQKTEKTIAAQLRTHKEAADTLRENTKEPVQPVAMVAETADRVLADYDLAKLWLPDTENGEAPVYNGFYGPDRYRIEMYFASVTKDTQRPNVYHVRGKSRYKKSITPFAGQIILDTIRQFTDPNLSEEGLKQMKAEYLYTAKGTFAFQEDSNYGGSGVFAGKIKLDFATHTTEGVSLWYYSETEDAQGAGFLFDGNWTSYKTGKSKPIIWASDIFMIANGILKDFSIGERDVVINPKYRKLGWDNFWENEEWWNEPAGTTL